MSVFFFVFFFSSRRRHTRFDCDWSSDVCSSDLEKLSRNRVRESWAVAVVSVRRAVVSAGAAGRGRFGIGRGAGRGKGEISGGGGSFKKKKKKKNCIRRRTKSDQKTVDSHDRSRR